MKRFFLFLLFFSALHCWGQHFEGLIKYKVFSFGGDLGSGETSYLTVIVKDKNFHLVGTDNNGQVVTEIFLNGDLDKMYMVISSTKTIYEMKISELQKQNPPRTEKINELGDSLNIMGYTCKHFRLESDDKVENVWVAPGMTVMDIGYQGRWNYHGIYGVMMKLETVYKNNQESIMEMTYFEAMTVDIRDFGLPEGYTLVQGKPFGN